MNNIWKKLNKPFTALAPMAGYTDQAFRLICKDFGVDLTYSEMVSSEAIWHNVKKIKNKKSKSKIKVSLRDNLYKTLKLIQFSGKERPYIVQIFGSKPDHMTFGAKYIASGEWKKQLKIKNLKLKIESIPDGIDVNMGCPVKDVVKTGAGVALMKDQENAIKIIKAIKKQVGNIPVSVKTRLGWYKNTDILLFARILEDAGADAIAIHGRTYKQGFTGKVDWEMIKKVKKMVKIPVIGNGGIGKSVQSVEIVDKKTNSTRQSRFNNLNNFNYGLDGYMVGTGALGNPWIFKKLKIYNEEFIIKNQIIKETILKHIDLMEELKGGESVIEFRKQLVWYVKGLDNARELRKLLVQINSYVEARKIVKNMV